MDWLVYLVVGVVVVVVWLFYGSRWHCPSCGVRFPSSIGNRIDETLGRTPRRCTRCGWSEDA